jgi:hypothetical protein
MKRSVLSSLILALLLIPAAAAEANSYDVYSCWAGHGTFRNPNASSVAWVKDNASAGGHFTAHDDCGTNSTSGAMTVISLSGYSSAANEFSRLLFTAPAGSTIAQVQLWRNAWSYGTGSGAGSQRNFVRVMGSGGASISGGGEADGTADVAYGTRGTPNTAQHGILPSNLLTLNPSSLGTNTVEYRVGCGWAAGCPTSSTSGPPPNYFASGADVFGTKVSIQDSSGPTLTVADTGLFSGTAQSGIRQVLVTQAADVSGIKKLAIFGDGAQTPAGVIDFEQDINRCEWFKPTPCLNVADAEIPLDTRQLPDGEHSVVVKAFDAAGNEKVSTTRTVLIKNGSDGTVGSNDPTGPHVPSGPGANESSTAGLEVPNGVGATGGARLRVVFDQNKKSSVKAKYGRTLVARGELTDDRGAPITEAQVDYGALATRPGARREDLGSLRTDRSGEFVLTVPTKLGSRQLRFAYRPRLGGPVAVTTDAQLDVLAPLSLKVGPKRVHNRHKVTFSGKLAAGPIPRKGKLVNLQVVVDGRWHTFATVRSSKAGKFRYGYRFKRTYGRMTYRFRALSRYEAAYPFVAGHSKTVRVHVN